MIVRSTALLLHATALGLALPASAASSTEEAEKHYVLKVLPLFKEKCLACHGDDLKNIKGGLDMRTRELMLSGGDSGEASFVPKEPDKSLLMKVVTREDDDLAMPPKENDKLTAEQIEVVRKWIADGAAWPDEKKVAELQKHAWEYAEGVPMKTSGGLSADWTNRRYKPEDLWAYQPLKISDFRSQISEGERERVEVNPVDAFINAKMKTLDVAPAPAADRATLIRRATYDLLGLPPTPEEIEAFVKDSLPEKEAFSKVVERLLASPHYGEHWGRHWLDVARYADSSGFANDYERGNAWRYRDYVIRAFNTDKPYDQFIVEQVAGDEMAEHAKAGEGGPAATSELVIAPGFLRMGPWELTGMEVAKVARQRFLDDVTDIVGQAFMGHTLQCARCHDHKFDPIPTRDYYAMQACFSTTQLVERPAAFLSTENVQGFEEIAALRQRELEHQATLVRLSEKSAEAARKWYAEKKLDPAPLEQALEEVKQPQAKGVGKGGKAKRQRGGYDEARNRMQQQGIPEDQIPPRHAGFTTEDYGMDRVARKGLERLKWELERYEPIAFSVYSGRTPDMKSVMAPLRMPPNRMEAGELEQTSILGGGDPFSPKEKVAPGVLSAAAESWGHRTTIPDEITGRRLALAKWIASPQNALTSRTMVNRIWQWHFGKALAGNPNNFGGTGKKPTHPELLDWLAGEFVAQGWSMKTMHRLIMSSEVYRRSAQHPERETLAKKDPESVSYASFTPRRLRAEELRDSMLAASGELNPVMGGIPARPEINLEAALQPRQVMGTFAAAWQPNPLPSQRHRRSIYVLKIRGLADPFMEVFNEPSPEFSCEARDASNVTPQVFSLFNSEATYDRAVALASRVLRESNGDRKAALQRACMFTTGASPDEARLGVLLAHWDQMTARHAATALPPSTRPKEVIREAVEENTGEKFSFTEKLHVYENFVPDKKMADVDANTRGLAEVCLVLLNSNEFAYVY
jgi:mono/diheme cytochrome c family protein